MLACHARSLYYETDPCYGAIRRHGFLLQQWLRSNYFDELQDIIIQRCAKFSRLLLGERQVTDEQPLHLGKSLNRPFYQYCSHIEIIRFKEYYGIPRGHSLGIYARFSGKKRTSMYISWQKRDHHYIQTRHNDLFFPLQFFSSKT